MWTNYDTIGLMIFAAYGLYLMMNMVWNQHKRAAWDRNQAALFQAYKEQDGDIDNEQ